MTPDCPQRRPDLTEIFLVWQDVPHADNIPESGSSLFKRGRDVDEGLLSLLHDGWCNEAGIVMNADT